MAFEKGDPRINRNGRPIGSVNAMTSKFRNELRTALDMGKYIEKALGWIDKLADKEQYGSALFHLGSMYRFAYAVPQDQLEYTAGHYAQSIDMFFKHIEENIEDISPEALARLKHAGEECALQNFADEE